MPNIPDLPASCVMAAALCAAAFAQPASAASVERHPMQDGSRLILESATVKLGATQVR